MSKKRHITISSQVSDAPDCLVQWITVPGLKTRFALGRFTIDGTAFTRYIILNDQLTKIFAIGLTRAEVLVRFWDLIEHRDDIDIQIMTGLHTDC